MFAGKAGAYLKGVSLSARFLELGANISPGANLIKLFGVNLLNLF
jgi:hypothetical protein